MQPSQPPDPEAEAARWFARRRGGDCTVGVQQDFLQWLNADEAHGKAYARAETLWRQMDGLEDVAGWQLRSARAHLARARRRPARRRVLALALAASLAAVMGWNSGWLDFPQEYSYRTALGERQAVTLDDGSRLELDTNSEVAVRYSRRYRELNLVRGQAAFTVAHSDVRRFVVRADNARIRDIGTQFDVRRYDNRVSVEVLEGAVEVSGATSGQLHLLSQGQRIGFTKQGEFSAVENIDVASAAAWREGKLVFHAQALGEVLTELRRYHTAALTVTRPNVMTVKVSGAFPVDDLPLTLKTIAATLGLKLTRTGAQSWRLGG